MGLCLCGCGRTIPDKNRYAHGHNPSLPPPMGGWNKGKPSPWATATHKGIPKRPESIAKRTASRLAKNGGVYQTAHGWKHSNETIARMKDANARKAMHGASNPAWRDGASFKPYPAEFNDSLKKLVWARAKSHCEACGIRLGQRGKKPNTHHINGDKSDCRLENLRLLCVPCHARAHWQKAKQEAAAAGMPPRLRTSVIGGD